ncbi:unnamed protein product [Bursaphelenchus okinawaensis]|uniref:BTB domain-containing protein n=1 Tax=Bursaphelenchus okinawaensis TaxID=465554 RepID=A0A811L8F9_9BILA|nr:unnamed protein product [Bursaphelenchus okinawaensis]CAG9117848.1 unnamed protein product [Bursaphelenchus okinawaensis]
MSNVNKKSTEIVNLNVGGQKFATSRSTLSWVPDTFFSSLLSGRISSTEDETGAFFIDRDPDLFRRILHYLRTQQIDLSDVNLSMFIHEAEFYGITPLVKRLRLCEEMNESPCGDVLFMGILNPPEEPAVSSMSLNQVILPVSSNQSYVRERRLSSTASSANVFNDTSRNSSASFSSGYITSSMNSSLKFRVNDQGQSGSNLHSNQEPTTDLTTRQVRKDLRRLVLRENELDKDDINRNSMRVRLIRAYQNAVAVAYSHFGCVYKMKESYGWKLCFTSAIMDSPIKQMAYLSKFPSQQSEKWLALGLTSNVIHLYVIEEGGDSQVHRTVRVFSLNAIIDKLFFIGSQLVALSWTGKVGVWNSMSHNWQVQDVMQISSYDTAGFILLLGCTNGSIYYIDMQKFPLRMKDNDLLITELYRDPNSDTITAISVYLTPKTSMCGNWIEIAYGTATGNVRVIVQHPETVGHGPQLFQTHSVHTARISRVALTTNYLISVCYDNNHVRSWSVTRFRGMINTQPGGQALASFKIMTLDSSPDDSPLPEGCNTGPYGEQDGEQIFVQRVVPDANTLFVLLASTGERLCTIKTVDSQPVTAFFVHECDGSNRMGARPRRYLFAGTANGDVQIFDLTTAIDQYQTKTNLISQQLAQLNSQTVQVGTEKSTSSSSSGVITGTQAPTLSPSLLNQWNVVKGFQTLQGPTPEELLKLIEASDLAVSSLNSNSV